MKHNHLMLFSVCKKNFPDKYQFNVLNVVSLYASSILFNVL